PSAAEILADASDARDVAVGVSTGLPAAAATAVGAQVQEQVAPLVLDAASSASLAVQNKVDAELAREGADEAKADAELVAASMPALAVTAVDEYLVLNPVEDISGPEIVWNGDSLSAQGGSTAQNPAGFLGVYLNRTVRTNAVGGEKTSGIGARQGGAPYQMLPAGGAIPASGGVTVTCTTPTGDVQYPLLQTNGNPTLGKTFVGYLHTRSGDIHGTLTLTQPSGASTSHQPDDFYTFTRTSAGAVVSVTRPASFYLDFGIDRREDIHVIMAGRNNVAQSIATQSVADCVTEVLAGVAAMVVFMEAANKRFLIVGVHNGTSEGTGTDQYAKTIAVNAALFAAYGRRFVDYRPYLIAYGLEDAGITPTTDDVADIAAQRVPRSLLTDGLHFQIATRQIVGKLVGDRMVELGWATVNGSAPTPPVQVTGLTATPGNTQASLAWALPADGGSAILDYTIQYKVATDAVWSTWAHTASTARTAVVTGLTNGTAYNFRVSARNAYGSGVYSATATSTPAAPFSISDDFNRADSLDLGASWVAPHTFAIVSNKLTRAAVSGTPGALLHATSMPSPDHQVSANIGRGTATTVGLILRAADGSNFYSARVNLATGNLLIYRLLSGTTVSLKGQDGLWVSDGDQLAFRAKGQLFEALINGSLAMSVTDTDTTLSNAVKVGVRADSPGATKPTFDNFLATLT
ncbi:fibronectin type III domain-containing protein, partial [Plantibacter sp. YIM 135249]|uniref:fibronectin type III domain-containing protein n=1 Tax=Plantibacter sp. YIM 135249 TaxID=3423918 RepID=UPI003D32BF15